VPITASSSIIVEGADLLGDSAIVEIDGSSVPTTNTANDRIMLTLPAAIAAGPHALQVRQGVLLGGVAPPRPVFASDLASFVVQPVITKTAGAANLAITNVQGAGAGLRSATVTIQVSPTIGVAQTATLEMLSGQSVVYRFLAQPLAAPATQLVFQIAGVTAGDYFFQLRVDGAPAPLDLGADGTATGPREAIP
jgi:hypothetical protein